MIDQTASYSLKPRLTMEQLYLGLVILFYGFGDLGTHYLNSLFTTLHEQNTFMQPYATGPHWLIYALIVKGTIIGLAYVFAKKYKTTFPYKILLTYGLYVTFFNSLGLLLYRK